jgi:hypothetical protein
MGGMRMRSPFAFRVFVALVVLVIAVLTVSAVNDEDPDARAQTAPSPVEKTKIVAVETLPQECVDFAEVADEVFVRATRLLESQVLLLETVVETNSEVDPRRRLKVLAPSIDNLGNISDELEPLVKKYQTLRDECIG